MQIDKPKIPILYIAAIDIGNRLDNTDRVKALITDADFLIVESFKCGASFLKFLGLKKEMIEISEHTTPLDIPSIVLKISQSSSVVLISDCGTPLFEDPGRLLVSACYDAEVRVVPVPGVCSVGTVIMTLPFPMTEFYYAGLLPRNNKEREQKLSNLKKLQVPIIILDTPYRLGAVLLSVERVFGKYRELVLALDLTMPTEQIVIDNISNILMKFKDTKKREFVLVLK